jgi:hypothetical protein
LNRGFGFAAMISNPIRAVTQPFSAVRLMAPWLAVILAALISGAIVSGQADAALGQKPALLLLGILVGIAFLGMFLYLGSTAVLIWPVAATGGYLLQLPRDNVILTFDRAIACLHRAKPAANPAHSRDSPTLLRPALASRLLRVAVSDDHGQLGRSSQDLG